MRVVWVVLVVVLGVVLILGVTAFPPGHRSIPFLFACALFAIGSRLLVGNPRNRER